MANGIDAASRFCRTLDRRLDAAAAAFRGTAARVGLRVPQRDILDLMQTLARSRWGQPAYKRHAETWLSNIRNGRGGIATLDAQLLAACFGLTVESFAAADDLFERHLALSRSGVDLSLHPIDALHQMALVDRAQIGNAAADLIIRNVGAESRGRPTLQPMVPQTADTLTSGHRAEFLIRPSVAFLERDASPVRVILLDRDETPGSADAGEIYCLAPSLIASPDMAQLPNPQARELRLPKPDTNLAVVYEEGRRRFFAVLIRGEAFNFPDWWDELEPKDIQNNLAPLVLHLAALDPADRLVLCREAVVSAPR